VIHDIWPPHNELLVGATHYIGEYVFLTKDTPLVLKSTDALVSAGDSLGLGVATQAITLDGQVRASFQNLNPAPGQTLTLGPSSSTASTMSTVSTTWAMARWTSWATSPRPPCAWHRHTPPVTGLVFPEGMPYVDKLPQPHRTYVQAVTNLSLDPMTTRHPARGLGRGLHGAALGAHAGEPGGQ